MNVSSLHSVTYFILGVLPEHILHWIYELFHTFFVVTGQMVTFSLMIFWLFLFLFTFFTIEVFEDYFAEKRLHRQNVLKKIKQLQE